MIKDIAARMLNLLRRGRNRIAYEFRSREVPTLQIDNKKDILVITVDCLRNDRISQMGHSRDTTPFLDGLTHTPAIAPAPWTFSSVPSILTGLYPHHHGAAYPDESSRNQDLNNPPNGVRNDVVTLSELLDEAGYETRFLTAIGTAAVPIEGRFKSMTRRHDAEAKELLNELQQWWTSESGPKFGYVQLGDLHEPLHRPTSEYFGSIPDIEGIDRWRFTDGDIDGEEFESYRSARELLYDTLVRSVDEQIEQFVEALDLGEETILVVTSDHGEEFWEYTEFEKERFDDSRGIYGVGHGHALVPPVIGVPILTNFDTQSSSRRSLVDIVPTILQSLGASNPLDLDGVPLQVSHSEPNLSQEIAYGPNQISVTDGDDHLIYVPGDDRSILLEFETGEVIDDSDGRDRLLEYVPEDRLTGSEVDVTDDVQERLADLGYAE